MKLLLESQSRNGVAVRVRIEAGDRAVMALALFQLLASPAGPPEEVFRRTMLIEAGGRAATAPARFWLLTPPAGPLEEMLRETME